MRLKAQKLDFRVKLTMVQPSLLVADATNIRERRGQGPERSITLIDFEVTRIRVLELLRVVKLLPRKINHRIVVTTRREASFATHAENQVIMLMTLAAKGMANLDCLPYKKTKSSSNPTYLVLRMTNRTMILLMDPSTQVSQIATVLLENGRN